MQKPRLVKVESSAPLGGISLVLEEFPTHTFSTAHQIELEKLISTKSIAQLSDLCGWAKVSSKAGQYGLSRPDRRKQLKKVEQAAESLLSALNLLDAGAKANLPAWINKGEGHEFGHRLQADLLALVHGVRAYSEVQKELSIGRPKSGVFALEFVRNVARIVAADGIKPSRTGKNFSAVCTVAWDAAGITGSMEYVLRTMVDESKAPKSSASRRSRTVGASGGEKTIRKRPS